MSKPLHWSKAPRRVEILVGSGAGYFKAGQFAYVIAQNKKGGMHFCNRHGGDGGSSAPGETAYLVSKTKDMRGGALWFSRDALRFTKRRGR